jgi:ubiquitin carboxyl-terminal hydrolase 36/42
MMVQDPARVKKVKPKVVSEGTTLHGGSVSRHQGVQLPMTNDISHTFDDYRDTSYPPAESPSPSESSSLFSNSDAGSHSTVSTESSESTRNSTSTDEYEYLIFGNSDQMYPGGPMTTAVENNYTVYACSRSSLNASSSSQESGDAERYTEHRLQGTRGGWVEGDEGSSFVYTDRSRQQLGSKLTEHRRQLDGTEHGPGETSGSNLSRRKSAREKTTQTFY